VYYPPLSPLVSSHLDSPPRVPPHDLCPALPRLDPWITQASLADTTTTIVTGVVCATSKNPLTNICKSSVWTTSLFFLEYQLLYIIIYSTVSFCLHSPFLPTFSAFRLPTLHSSASSFTLNFHPRSPLHSLHPRIGHVPAVTHLDFNLVKFICFSHRPHPHHDPRCGYVPGWIAFAINPLAAPSLSAQIRCRSLVYTALDSHKYIDPRLASSKGRQKKALNLLFSRASLCSTV